MSLTVPPAPAAPVVTAGDSLIQVGWSAPAFDPSEHRAVVGYILTPYIGTTALSPLNFDGNIVDSMPLTLTADGDGVNFENDTTYTFRVRAISSVGLGAVSLASVPVTPNPAAQVALTAEPWDYSTNRLRLTVTKKMREELDLATLSGHEPRITITRSGYGSPTTPLDGDKLFDLTAQEALTLPYQYHVNNTIAADDLWVRPVSPEASVYDHNLQQGRWCYYTLFMMVLNEDSDLEWKSYATAKTLVPIDYHHRDRLWDMIPDYYRNRDEEFLVYPEVEGDLKRFINILGFELDFTRTLAEGVQDIYQVEKASDTFIQLLGETNLGTIKEEGLGEIRYRSLVAVLTRLYAERGTLQGIKNLASVTSKYRTVTTEGINRMRESDDAEFSTAYDEPQAATQPFSSLLREWKPLGSGSWAAPYLPLLQALAPHSDGRADYLDRGAPFFGGLSYNEIRGRLSPDDYPVSAWPTPTAWPDAPTVAKRGGRIGRSADLPAASYQYQHPEHPGVTSSGLVLCCGAGLARTGDRFHNLLPRLTMPAIHGIRCTSGHYYDWSIYSQRVFNQNLGDFPGTVSIGVMWFGALKGVDAADLAEYPFINDDVTRLANPRGFRSSNKPSPVGLPPFEALNYLDRDERVWTPDPTSPLLDSYPYPVTVSDTTDSSRTVYDSSTNRLNPRRYYMRTVAPSSNGPEDFVFAVPYVAFSDSSQDRYIGSAMFSEEANPRNQYIVTRRLDPVYDDSGVAT